MNRTPNIAAPRGGGSLVLAWRLGGRRVLVVGGGTIAAQRVLSTLDADADVHVVAPSLNPELRARLARGEITWTDRRFEDSDIEGAAMVLAAIDDHDVSEHIAQLARSRNIPVNVADIPRLCDFYFPSVHRDGPVQIAVSTGGQGPALATRFRRFIGEVLPKRAGEATRRFGAFRRALRKRDPAPLGDPLRMEWVAAIGHHWPVEDLADLDDAGIDALVEQYLRGDPPPRGPRGGARIQLVGAGPGDPKLLTQAATEAIREADLVLADRIVPKEILDLATGEVVVADKRKGNADPAQTTLEDQMVAGYRAGLHVVRLKCGDPCLFGRAGEEIAWLRGLGIEAEVLAGLSSALTAPLAAGIPVTHRGVANRLLVWTAVGKGGSKPDIPAYEPEMTQVVLMGVGRLPELSEEMLARGYPADLPVAVIERATWASQRVVRGELDGITELAGRGGVRSPATIVIGWVAGEIPDVVSSRREQGVRATA